MIPRADIGAVEINDSFEKVLQVFIKEAHSNSYMRTILITLLDVSH